MLKRRSILIVVVILLLVSFMGCNKRSNNPLVGTWQNTRAADHTITFNNDGTFHDRDMYSGSTYGKYTIDKNKSSCIIVNNDGYTATIDFNLADKDTLVFNEISFRRLLED